MQGYVIIQYTFRDSQFVDDSFRLKSQFQPLVSSCWNNCEVWNNFTAFSYYNKLKSAYVKCCKIFFGYNKYYSVTAMLHELDFSDFNAVIGSHQHALHRQILLCDNDVVNHFVRLRLL